MKLSSDTNIWVDFQTINALNLPFYLSHDFYMSNEAVIDEMLSPVGKDTLKYGLEPVHITDDEFFYAMELMRKYSKLSKYDSIALSMAKHRGDNLLTGDGRLRKAAYDEGVEVKGTLWVLDEMLSENVIDDVEYLGYLEEIEKYNGRQIRLPAKEIEFRKSTILQERKSV